MKPTAYELWGGPKDGSPIGFYGFARTKFEAESSMKLHESWEWKLVPLVYAEYHPLQIALRIKSEEHAACAEDLIRWRESAEAAIAENVELRADLTELAQPATDAQPVAWRYRWPATAEYLSTNWEYATTQEKPRLLEPANGDRCELQPLYTHP